MNNDLAWGLIIQKEQEVSGFTNRRATLSKWLFERHKIDVIPIENKQTDK